MLEDKRDGVQKLLNKTRWQPFSYITDSNIVLHRPGGGYLDIAMVTSAIILHMIHHVKRDAARTPRLNKDSGSE